MPDSIRFENYELLRREDGSVFELGRGAMGVTYRAFDTDLHCQVALKVINPGILGSGDVAARFLREARAAAQLRHPNIATVFRLGRAADDTHFYAMEFCEGPTLAQAVMQRGRLPAAEAVHVAWQVSKALILAEQHRLLHRDLKPSNLILTERRDEGVVVKVIDFGLAKSFADGQQSLATMGTGGFVGTAQFASPEQLEEKELDIRSDIYSLGMCLWFMLAGRPPFEGSIARVMTQTLTAEPPWAALDGQPGPVIALLRKMLAKDREDRPPTAVALREELETCLRAFSSPSPDANVPAPSARSAGDDFRTRYRMFEGIAQDALGRVHRATDTAHGDTTVAVRVIEPALMMVPALRREMEARLTAAKAHPHPNLLSPLAFAPSDQGFLVVTEWIHGFSLFDLLKHRGILSPADTLRLLEPLSRAVDHAMKHRLGGLDLAKGQVAVHFPGSPGESEINRLLTEVPLAQWPVHEIKAGVLGWDAAAAPAADVSLVSMATMIPGTGFAATSAPGKALAALACELLGASGAGGFTPIARLNERANAVLRRAVSDDQAFTSAAAFYDAFAAVIGKEGGSVPAARPSPASAIPNSPPKSSRWQPALVASLGVMALASYWFGIHQPRERDREKRQTEAKTAATDLAEKQRLAIAEQERIQTEAEKQRLAAAAEVERTKIKAEAELEKAKQQEAVASLEQARQRRVRDLIGKMTAWLDEHEGETTDEALPLWKAMVAEIRQLPAPANADSSAYSALLVGEWNTRNRGYTYRRDGTWTSSRGRGDPDPPVHGSWRIEGNVFIEDGTRYTIICLDESAFVYMEGEGVSFMKHDWSATPVTAATTTQGKPTTVSVEVVKLMPPVQQPSAIASSSALNPQSTKAEGVWLFPDSSSRFLNRPELATLDADSLWRARNEIYARNGLAFSSPQGKAYAARLGSAYRAIDADQTRIFARMNKIEQANVELIKSLEQRRR